MKRCRRIFFVVIIVAFLIVAFWFSPLFPFVAGMLGGYNASIRSGQREIAAVGQFCDLYPTSRHFITYYTGWYGKPTWNSEVGLHGRYILTMQIKISFDALRIRVHALEEPRFYLHEIETVRQLPGGGFQIEYVSSGQREIRLLEWERLYNADGDLHTIGIAPRIDSPVPGFEHALTAQ